MAPAAAGEPISLEELRHQRTELVARIAELTDEADRSQAAAAEARQHAPTPSRGWWRPAAALVTVQRGVAPVHAQVLVPAGP